MYKALLEFNPQYHKKKKRKISAEDSQMMLFVPENGIKQFTVKGHSAFLSET
jgi:hypothetical protein